jgi:hypothetical protein
VIVLGAHLAAEHKQSSVTYLLGNLVSGIWPADVDFYCRGREPCLEHRGAGVRLVLHDE